jgi:4-methylaminobutanoate oxidase (formaldehyde-forming)
MHWPYKQFKTGRNLRRSAWHQQLEALGAVFGAPTGWERPLWFATNADEEQFEYSYAEQCWWPAARCEALHCQRGVSLFELSPFTKIDILGRDALSLLQEVCCGDVDIETGRVLYSLMLNRRGGIEAEVTVARLAQNHFRVVSGAATRFKDLFWLRRYVTADMQLDIQDVTEDYAVLGVMGPGSRSLLQDLSDADFSDRSFPFSSFRAIRIDGEDLLATRLSFVGELGWELYIPVATASSVLAEVLRAGQHHDLGFAGHFALDSCRIEKGFLHWGHDMGPDDTPFEVGLGFTVNFHKVADFIGKKSLLEQRQRGWSKHLRLCAVAAAEALVLHDEPVYLDGQIVGHCTSASRGFRTGKSLCLVMFYRKVDLTDECLIEIAGQRIALAILDKPPYQVAM